MQRPATEHAAPDSAQTLQETGKHSVSSDLTWKDMLALRTGELVIAALFLTTLAWWLPIIWLALTWIVNFGVFFYRRSERSRQHSTALRHRVIHVFSALDALTASSAGYLLHSPTNFGMQMLLHACLIVVAVAWIVERPRNGFVGGLGATAIILPSGFVPLFDAAGLTLINILLAFGLCVLCAVLWLFALKQEASIAEQTRLRSVAEEATRIASEAGASKVRFFAAASHDLRQPVHAIGLYLAPLLNKAVSTEERRALMGIHQSWKLLDELLTQILDLARLDNQSLRAELHPVALEPLAQEVVYSLYASAEKKAVRLVVICSQAAFATADTFMLRRVLTNLVENAIKFSPADSAVAIVIRQHGGEWAVQVRDSGIGIDVKDHSHIFEEFVQVHNPERNRQEGVGLGLFVVRRFVEIMGGSVQIRSALGCGTTITVRLPKAAAPQRTDMQDMNAATEGQREYSCAIPRAFHWNAELTAKLRTSRKSLLLVEDDLLVAEAFCAIFTSIQVPVIHVVDAVAALAELDHAAAAICDLRLPGAMNGLALALVLRERRIPAILVSGENSPETINKVKDIGLPFMQKPVDPQALLDQVTILLESNPMQTIESGSTEIVR